MGWQLDYVKSSLYVCTIQKQKYQWKFFQKLQVNINCDNLLLDKGKSNSEISVTLTASCLEEVVATVHILIICRGMTLTARLILVLKSFYSHWSLQSIFCCRRCGFFTNHLLAGQKIYVLLCNQMSLHITSRLSNDNFFFFILSF